MSDGKDTSKNDENRSNQNNNEKDTSSSSSSGNNGGVGVPSPLDNNIINNSSPPSSSSSSNTPKIIPNLTTTQKRKRNVEEPQIGKSNTRKKAKLDTETFPSSETDLSAEDLDDVALSKPSATPEKKLNELLEPMVLLRSHLENILNKLPKPNTPAVQEEVWGKLYPQFSNQPAIPLFGIVFTIGRSPKCNLPLKDSIVNGVLCRIHFVQGSAFLESMSGSGILSLNQRIVRKQGKLLIRSGDEISITGNQTYSYVFQQTQKLPNIPRSENLTDVDSPQKVLTSGIRPGHLPFLSLLSPEPTPSDKSNPPTASFLSSLNRISSLRSGGTLTLTSSLTVSENLPGSPPGAPPVIEVNLYEKEVPFDRTDDLTISEKDKTAEFKSQLVGKIESAFILPENVTVGFDNFPYYLAPSLKQLLINSVYLYLKKPEFAKFTKSIPTLSRRILISGQKGTQIFQEKLVQALAKHFDAKILLLDDCFQDPQKSDSAGESLPGSSPTLTSILEDLCSIGTGPFDSNPPPRCSFKKGDKVRFVGSGTTGTSGAYSTSLLRHLQPPRNEDKKGIGSNSLGSIGGGGLGPSLTAAARLGPSSGYTGKVMLTFDDNPRKVGVRFDKQIPGGINLGDLCEDSHGFFVDSSELKHEHDHVPEENADCLTIEALFETLSKPENQPCVVFIKNFEKTILPNYERYVHFKKELEKLDTRTVFFASVVTSGNPKDKTDRPGFVLSSSSKSGTGNPTALLDLSFLDHLSRIEERKETTKTSKLITKLFPSKISVHPPKNSDDITDWQKSLDRDRQRLKREANLAMLRKVLTKNDLTCPNLDAVDVRKKVFPRNQIEKVVGWALSEQVMAAGAEEIKVVEGEVLVLDAKFITEAFLMLEHSNPPKAKSIYDIETDNDFEKRLLSDVIPPNELKLSFDSIGALDKVKGTLKELVMLPLQRPELFRKGNLTKPCKGILLFGPPGTGKTMLAKAIATESGANFISISMASIGSKWFGEGEKYARAVFTLASKIAPCVVFIDEVDCILGRREQHGEHEAMRKIKNEFMMMWDGLKTRQNERVLVLAATNRPFDLDDAVLRRLPRRLLVDLPDTENRLKILKVILKDEDLDLNLDLNELSKMTEGFSGSDMHNLCIAAAYQPIREFLTTEKKESSKKVAADTLAASTETDLKKPTRPDVMTDITETTTADDPERPDPEERETPHLRHLTMADFERAKKEISASVSEDAHAIAELRKWNDLYGEGGSRRKTTLSYFV